MPVGQGAQEEVVRKGSSFQSGSPEDRTATAQCDECAIQRQQTDADPGTDIGPPTSIGTGAKRSIHVTSILLGVHIGRVDDLDDPEERAAEEGHRNGSDKPVLGTRRGADLFHGQPLIRREAGSYM